MNRVVIIGSGLTGLTAAIELAEKKYDVYVLYKTNISENNSYKAQGGVSIPVLPQDSSEKHFQDTVKAGKYLNDKDMTEILVNSTEDVKYWLEEKGVRFDTTPTKEAAHSENRILHIGDITGMEIHQYLIKYIKFSENDIKFLEVSAYDFVTDEKGYITKVRFFDKNSRKKELEADVFLLATGGVGGVFENTSNSSSATGDGIAMAWLAGAEVSDMEFIQFHPTVFYGAGKRFLLSESLRGEGGKIVDEKNNQFLKNYHEDAELAPRDIVSLSIIDYMKKNNLNNVYLDMTHLDKNYVLKRFPNISRYCKEAGLDISTQKIPVRPAAHYFIGGIKIDNSCHTSISNLFAAGECAASYVHGANRLASNSLLECVVFGLIAAERIAKKKYGMKNYNSETLSKKLFKKTEINNVTNEEIKKDFKEMKIRNDEYIGIVREKERLKKHYDYLMDLLKKYGGEPASVEEAILKNAAVVSMLITKSALIREESRGVHQRMDYPLENPDFRGHIILTDIDKHEIISVK